MPSLVSYERKALSEAQCRALRNYIARKRRKEEMTVKNGLSKCQDSTNMLPSTSSDAQCNPPEDSPVPDSPGKPSAQEVLEKKQQSLKHVRDELADLQDALSKLKEKKHKLFEEIKSLLHTKKQDEEREKLMQSFTTQFLPHSFGQGNLMNVSPYRAGLQGIKRPRSPSPPLVHLYSDPLNSTSDVQQLYLPVEGRICSQSDKLIPNYQHQQNHPHHPHVGPYMNFNIPPNSLQTAGNQFVHHDRNMSSYGNVHVPRHRMSETVAHQNFPRAVLTNPSPPFPQPNMLTGQQKSAGEGFTGFGPSGSKDRPGFGGSTVHRLYGYGKRDSHGPSRSRYY